MVPTPEKSISTSLNCSNPKCKGTYFPGHSLLVEKNMSPGFLRVEDSFRSRSSHNKRRNANSEILLGEKTVAYSQVYNGPLERLEIC